MVGKKEKRSPIPTTSRGGQLSLADSEVRNFEKGEKEKAAGCHEWEGKRGGGREGGEKKLTLILCCGGRVPVAVVGVCRKKKKDFAPWMGGEKGEKKGERLPMPAGGG